MLHKFPSLSCPSPSPSPSSDSGSFLRPKKESELGHVKTKNYAIYPIVLVLLLLASCGYRFSQEDGVQEPARTISVPYVQGDGEGYLTSELIRQLADSGYFEYVQGDGELILNAVIAADTSERIGFRYDRHGPQAKKRHRLVPTENRRSIAVDISVIHGKTQEVLLDPIRVTADVDYDYIDPNSLRELIFVDTAGVTQKTVDFSLGQLDSIEGGQDGSTPYIYRLVSQKIVDGLIQKKL